MPEAAHAAAGRAVPGDLRQIDGESCAGPGMDVIRLTVELDHVHLFVRASPQTAVQEIAQTRKGRTSWVLRDRHEQRSRRGVVNDGRPATAGARGSAGAPGKNATPDSGASVARPARREDQPARPRAITAR
ncbi:MAG: transposase [Solirubrobacterales bacterium]|nr:transposase [Solirubrobacterales bacterium]